MPRKGFGLILTADELSILYAFATVNSIAYPLGSLSIKETNDCIQSLKRKQVITGNGPYKLTKLGLRLRNSEIQREQRTTQDLKKDNNMTEKTEYKEYPAYKDFIPLNVDEVTALHLWTEENYPQYKCRVSRDTRVAKIGYNLGDLLEMEEQVLKQLRDIDCNYFLHLVKYYEESVQDNVFVVSILEKFTFTEKGTLAHTLNELRKYLIDMAYNILPATTGLNPKTKLFKDELVNDVREE